MQARNALRGCIQGEGFVKWPENRRVWASKGFPKDQSAVRTKLTKEGWEGSVFRDSAFRDWGHLRSRELETRT